MKKLLYILSLLLISSSCYDRDIVADAPIVGELEGFTYLIDDDTLRVEWELPVSDNDLRVQINSTEGTTYTSENASSYNYGVIRVGKEYRFTFKVMDSSENLSLGKTIHFTRKGGESVRDLKAMQIDKTKNVFLSWNLPNETLTKVEVRYGKEKVELSGHATECLIENLEDKDYNFGVISFNDKGQSSETIYKKLRVGSTKFAFLGNYSSYDDFKNYADDDELGAAFWFFEKSGFDVDYISFDDIVSGLDLSKYRALWWIYDSENGIELPEIAKDASYAISHYHANGGGLLLNTHSVAYLWEIGRLTDRYNKTIGNNAGFHNLDVWGMNIQIGNHDESEHPIYEGVELTINNNSQKIVNLIGPGWKEDHNYVQIEVPSYYGLGNADEKAYEAFKSRGIRVLGMWSHIQDYYMFANFECEPTESFSGTAIAIGLGGFEWNQNNDDGSKVNPYIDGLKQNIYQRNIELITKNILDYLKTK